MVASPPSSKISTRAEKSVARLTPFQIDQLVNQYTDNLMRAAFSLGFNEQDAEELVQDTFVAYIDGQGRFQGKSKLLTYLFGILYNKARTARRLQAREEATESIEEVFDSHFDAAQHWNDESMQKMSEPEKRTHASALAVFLQQCLEGLSATLRMAFTLKEVEGTDTPAICQVLDITPTHLGVCLFRARNKLRECLTAKGVSIL